MEKFSNSRFEFPGVRFALDNIIDGARDDSLIVWEALDTETSEPVWVLSRKIKETPDGGTQVLPCAILLDSTLELATRYAPAKLGGGWDSSRIPAGRRPRIVIP